jgi:hypothetical protein
MSDGSVAGGSDVRAGIDLQADLENLVETETARRDAWVQVLPPLLDAADAPTWTRDLLQRLADARQRIAALSLSMWIGRPDVLPGFQKEARSAIGYGLKAARDAAKRLALEAVDTAARTADLHAHREAAELALTAALLGHERSVASFCGARTLAAIGALAALEAELVARERIPNVSDVTIGLDGRRRMEGRWNQPNPERRVAFVCGPALTLTAARQLMGEASTFIDREDLTAERLGLRQTREKKALEVLLAAPPGSGVLSHRDAPPGHPSIDSRAICPLRKRLEAVGWTILDGHRSGGPKGYRLEPLAAAAELGDHKSPPARRPHRPKSPHVPTSDGDQWGEVISLARPTLRRSTRAGRVDAQR